MFNKIKEILVWVERVVIPFGEEIHALIKKGINIFKK